MARTIIRPNDDSYQEKLNQYSVQSPKVINRNSVNNQTEETDSGSAFNEYSKLVSRVSGLNELINDDKIILGKEKIAELKSQRDMYLQKIKNISPEAREQAQELQSLRSAESNISRAETAGGMVGYVAATVPLTSTVNKLPAKMIPIAGSALGTLGEIGAEVGSGIAGDIASQVTGVKPGQAMEEYARLKGFPDRRGIEAIVNTPDILTQGGVKESLKDLPDEYKNHIINQYSAGPDRIKIWTALYKEPETYNELLLATGNDSTIDDFAKKAITSGAIETAFLGAGRAASAIANKLPSISTRNAVKSAFTSEPTLSQEAIEAAESVGLKVPYSEKYIPTEKGIKYVKFASSPESELSKLFRENTKKSQEVFEGTRTQLLDIIENKARNEGISTALKTAKDIQKVIGDDILDTTILQLRMAQDGLGNINVDNLIQVLNDKGYTQKTIANMTAAEVKEIAKREIGNIPIMAKGDRALAMKKILSQANNKYRETSSLLFDSIRDKGVGVKVDLDDMGLDDIIDKYFGTSTVGMKAKGSAVSAIEKDIGSELSRDRDMAKSVIDTFLNQPEIDFNELLRFRQDLDAIFPKNNRQQMAALSEIRKVITGRLQNAAENAGFSNEYRTAMEYYTRYRKNVDSSIYKKILNDDGLTQSYAKTLLEGEGNYQIVKDIVSELPPRKQEWFNEVMRNTALDSMVGGSYPGNIYNNLGRELKKLSSKDYNKIQEIYSSYAQKFKQAKITDTEVSNLLEQMNSDIKSISSLENSSKNKINQMIVRLKDSEIGEVYDPAKIKMSVANELKKYDTGDSILENTLDRDQLQNLLYFAEGADAASGRLRAMSATNPIQHGQKTSEYFAMTGQPGKFAAVMGYLAFMAGRQKTIAKMLISPDKKVAITTAEKAMESLSKGVNVAANAQNIRRYALQYMREAYKDDEGVDIPMDDLININNILKKTFGE